jgi:hypothetical protein
MLSIINSNVPGTHKSLGADPARPFVVVEHHGAGIVSPVDRFKTHAEASDARSKMLLAVALAAFVAFGGSASAETINVTDQWYQLATNGQAAQDLSQGSTPNFEIGSTLSNGAPIVSNANAFDDANNNTGALNWWSTSGNGTYSMSGPSATAIVNGNSFNVANNGGSFSPGLYAEQETITFSNATAVSEPLTLTGNGTFVMYENGREILSHTGAGNFTSSIGETLQAGSNTLEIFAAWDGFESGSSPTLNVDPSFTSPAIVTTAGAAPEPSTWAMLLVGFAGLSFVGYRRHKASRLAA